MEIQAVIEQLERLAPPAYQESYDNAGLITGHPKTACTGILISLDVTAAVIEEAIAMGVNLVVAHHPIIFKELKQITGRNYVEKTIIAAIKSDIAIYAIHTNLDNVLTGVNHVIADRLGLINRRILLPKAGTLRKLVSFVPENALTAVQEALFAAGAGQIGAYDQCSFSARGTGTFRAGEGTDPYVGNIGERHIEAEARLEVLLPAVLQQQIVSALVKAHPYEEVAYDLFELQNDHPGIGSGLIGDLPLPQPEATILALIAEKFEMPVVRHTPLLGKPVQRVALCGGAGSFLISNALRAGADLYLSADIKYHEFFEANDRMVVADIGHYESEQFTMDLLQQHLLEKFTTFAVRKTTVNTNPVQYYVPHG